MNYDERKEYMAHIKKRSRNLEIETKKDILKQQYRKENYKRRFARYRQKRTEDLRDSEEIEHETDKDMLKRYLKWEETDIKKYSFTLSKHEEDGLEKVRAGEEDADEVEYSDEGEPYWMDYDNEDNERDGIAVFEKIKPGELEEEYKAWDKQAKIIKKKEYKKPMPALAEREQCQYEKIRDSIIKERLEAMRESGLFDNFDEMKERIYKEKLIVEQKS